MSTTNTNTTASSASSGGSNVEVLSEVSVSGTGSKKGTLLRVRHMSTSTSTPMTFALFLPSAYALSSSSASSIPALYWLSGLTCDDTNFSTKASAAFAAAEGEGLAIVIPDTSPRGDAVPDADGYDLGQGAGFYVDATAEPWSAHYRMRTYVSEELPALISSAFNGVGSAAKSICGHSMGGHGALTLALSDPAGSWTSVSALAPICNPTECPWGRKAFGAYLTGGVEDGKAAGYDATVLLRQRQQQQQDGGPRAEYDDILVDQGLADQFLAEGQLLPENLEAAAAEVGQTLTVRRHDGFDHSYYFIAAFIGDHVAFHSKRLRKAVGKKRAAEAEAKAEDGTLVGASFSETAGKPIKCRAMVARAPKQPMVCEEITVDPPKAGEGEVAIWLLLCVRCL